MSPTWGGTSADQAYGAAADTAGNVYVVGTTFSHNFPVTSGVFQTAKRNDYDAFLAKLNPSGSALVYSTLLGGNGPDVAMAVAVDSSGRAWLAGYTASTDFPLQNAWQTVARGHFDAFLVQLSHDGSQLLFSTYMGGSGDDRATGLALAGSAVLVAGLTASPDFPSTTGSQPPAPYNAFLAKVLTSLSPSAISVSPNSGSGAIQTFTFTLSDPNGYADITQVNIFINAPLAAANGCWVTYARWSNSFSLANDNAAGYAGDVVPGSSTLVQNSQCILSGAGTSATGSGNILTLSLALSFKPAFAALGSGPTKSIVVYAVDSAGFGSGWAQLGTWTVPTGNLAPSLLSVSPSSGSGASQTFTFTLSDPNGYADITQVDIFINAPLAAANGCWVTYARWSNSFSLANDNAAGYAGDVVPGSSTLVQNSQCILSGAGTSATGSGNILTLSLALSFKPAFAAMGSGPTKTVAVYAVDAHGLGSGWLQSTWTVTSY